MTATGVAGAPVGLASGFGSVWVAVSDTDTVVRLDGQGQIVGQVPVGRTPLRLAVVPHGVWVSEFGAGTVALVDPAVGRRRDPGERRSPAGGADHGRHRTCGSCSSRTAAWSSWTRRPAPRSAAVRLPAGGEPRLAAYAPAAAGRRATVWVSDFGGNRVVPVDAATGKVGTPVPRVRGAAGARGGRPACCGWPARTAGWSPWT